MAMRDDDIASIEYEDARVQWMPRMYSDRADEKRLIVHHYLEFGWYKDPPGFNRASWTGHGTKSWTHRGAYSETPIVLSDQERHILMLEMIVEFILEGWNAELVIGEFCKIKSFYEAGAQSIPLRRFISTVTYGRTMSDWPPGSGLNGGLL